MSIKNPEDYTISYNPVENYIDESVMDETLNDLIDNINDTSKGVIPKETGVFHNILYNGVTP